jgi:hypothetical protein
MEKRQAISFEGINVDYPAYMNNLKLAGILVDLAEKIRNEPHDPPKGEPAPGEQGNLIDEPTRNATD